jgi:VWFA-related protein
MRRATYIALLATCALRAQQAPDAVFKATTKLVQVIVIAQDKSGKPVADLRREEFQIFDNGSRQEVRLFLAESEKSATTVSEPKTPGTFTNQIASSSASRTGYSVILIDDLFSDFHGGFLLSPPGEGFGFGVQKALQLLQSIPMGEKIAIYALERKLQVVCEFTTDRDLLERQLRVWKPNLDTPGKFLEIVCGYQVQGEAQFQSKSPPTILKEEDKPCAAMWRIDNLGRESDNSDVMDVLVDHLAGIPGRKNLIWLSNRFVIAPRALQKFSDASVAIYPVDVAGVCPSCIYTDRRPLLAIAKQTGGVAYYLRNDLDVAMREAMEDGRTSYTLGFYASGDDRAPQVHQLTARVNRSGVTLRYRTSYQTEAPRMVSVTTKADLAKALDQPVDASAIPVKASITRTKDRLNLETMLDVENLGLAFDRGLWTGKIEAVARFATADGIVAGDVFSETVTLSLRQSTYDAAVRTGLAYHKLELKIPDKAAELKLLFANPASGKIGTLTVPLSAVEVKSP